MATFTELYDRLDPDIRVRGKQFERICKWYLENNPYYRDTVRKVWLWDDWEHMWGGDAGIDLVAEDCDGLLWAVQAKAYNPTRAVTKKDVDKFLSESSRKWFSYRLLIATTDRLHHVAQRTIDDQEKKVGFHGLTGLLTAEVDWPEAPDHLRPVKRPKAAKPRNYQREAIRNVVKGFRAADRGQLIMACGTGKTLTSLFIREKLNAQRTLVLLPSLSLLKQTLAVWRANAKEPFEALPVCSDETVSRKDDPAIAHISELCLPAKSNPSDIADFLRRRSAPRVVFSTYQSSPQIAKAFALGRVPQFDLAVADESHRVAVDQSSVFAKILDANAIKARRRLFMTATPRSYTGRVSKAAQESGIEVASMDDPAKFGEVFHELSFGQAIREGLLTDYQVAIVVVDDSNYREWVEKGLLIRRDDENTDARTLARQIGLAKAMRKYNLHRVISFHNSVLGAKKFAAEIPDVLKWMPAQQRPSGPLWTGFASGEMSAGERHVRLQRLRQLGDGERGLLTNARCLSEGVDVPTLDGVAFIDPRRSKVDIVQAVGRAIRKSEDKTIGTVVIPVFSGTTEDPEIALDDSAFKPAWDVIRALRSHDEGLGEQLDELRFQLGRGGGKPQLPNKIRLDLYLDLPKKVSADFASAFDVRLVEQTTASWEFWVGLLQRYVAEVGHAIVPYDCEYRGLKLGLWSSNQRHAYRSGRLDTERIQQLEDMPGWSWRYRDHKWDEFLQILKGYIEEHGSARVEKSYKTVDGYPLGMRVASIRVRAARGKLSPERYEQLDGLPGWVWNTQDDAWERNLNAMATFISKHGHSKVPGGFRVGNADLNAWAGAHRRLRKRGVLDESKAARLESIEGWSWDPEADQWMEGFNCLLRYGTDKGHFVVPVDFELDDYPLGSWARAQRRVHAEGKIPADRKAKLDALVGWSWNPKDDQWEEGFGRLVAYVNSYGDARVQQSYEDDDGYPLGNWVVQQRHRGNKNKISSDRKRRLEALPGWTWNPKTDRWEEGYSRLLIYIKKNGHARVPPSYEDDDGYPLGRWVVTNRHRGNKNTIGDERQRRLESLPGWTWDPMTAKWEQGFNHLLEYIDRRGHALVKTSYKDDDGYPLGAWVSQQRIDRKKGRLDDHRQRRLEVLPGWTWNPPTGGAAPR